MPPGPRRGDVPRRARRVDPASSDDSHRARHSRVWPARRAGPRCRGPLGGRGRARRRRPPDAGGRLPHGRPRRGGRRRAVGLSQPVRGQRRQALLGRGRQAAGRLGGRDRGADSVRMGRTAADGRRHRAGPGGAWRRAPLSRRAPSQSAAGLGPGGLPSRARLRSRRNLPRRSAPLSRARGRGRDARGRGRTGRTSTARRGRSTPRRSRRASARRPERSVSRSTATATA